MQVETKLTPGDKCWFISQSKVVEKEIKRILVEISIDYRGTVSIKTVYLVKMNIGTNETYSLNEELIFATKQELLDSL